MPHRSKIAFVLIGFFTAGLIYFFATLPGPRREGEFTRQSELAQAPGQAGPSAAPLLMKPIPLPPHTETEPVRSWAPRVETLRQEVERDPHATPKSLTTFAGRLGPLMERGFRDTSYAEQLTRELQSCVWDESLARSARALCLSNVERLAATHPRLRDSAAETRRGASPEIIRLADSSKKLKKG